MEGLTDIIATVTVSKTEYEFLVRESEKLDILKNFIKNGKYTTIDDIKSISGISEKEGDQNDGN